jgi:hypothetical protein
MYANPKSGFVAAVIKNESLAPITKDKQRIDEMITFAILNKVKGAAEYQAQYINNKTQKLKVKSWRGHHPRLKKGRSLAM